MNIDLVWFKIADEIIFYKSAKPSSAVGPENWTTAFSFSSIFSFKKNLPSSTSR